jgi:hypothetical protein
MLNKIRLIAGFATICLLSSCFSTMNVRVDAFDMDKMQKSREYQRQKLESELKAYNTRINGSFFNDMSKLISDSVRGALSALDNFDQSQLPGVMAQVDSAINVEMNLFKSKMADTRGSLSKLLNSEAADFRAQYEATQASYDRQLDALKNYLQDLLDQSGVRDKTVIDNIGTLTEDIKAMAVPAGIFGNTITDDRMASYVAKAPEQFWQKYKTEFYDDESNLAKSDKAARINRTKVTTVVGNSDIAIKMDGPGSFVIKGVRLDADQAFRTSFKVLSQSIQHFSGISIPAPSQAKSGGTAEEPLVPELQNLDANRQQAAALSQEHEKLTNTFLTIVAAYKDDLTSSNTAKRVAAIQAVKQAYNYYKSQLTVQ